MWSTAYSSTKLSSSIASRYPRWERQRTSSSTVLLKLGWWCKVGLSFYWEKSHARGSPKYLYDRLGSTMENRVCWGWSAPYRGQSFPWEEQDQDKNSDQVTYRLCNSKRGSGPLLPSVSSSKVELDKSNLRMVFQSWKKNRCRVYLELKFSSEC